MQIDEFVDDLERVDLPDRRLVERALEIAGHIHRAPGRSFPRMVDTDGQLVAIYRFLNNPRVTQEALFEAHVISTAERVRCGRGPVLVVHDTTAFCFPGEVPRAGLGLLPQDGQGFFGHFALAVTERDGLPLGLLSTENTFRLARRHSKHTYWLRSRSDKESSRWERGVQAARDAIGDFRGCVVHVMDAEGDQYHLFEEMVLHGDQFVIRLAQNRRIIDQRYRYLFDCASGLRARIKRDAFLSRRSDRYRRLSQKRKHPKREQRLTTVSIASRPITIRAPDSDPTPRRTRSLELNLVRVWEAHPPSGQRPVEWFLLTTLATAAPRDLERIVDIYRQRWVIEEFFKALKTGCAYEKRQLESRHALLNALALLAPAACQLLALRTLAQLRQDTPASTVLSVRLLGVLRALSPKEASNRLSAREALLVVAKLGGFLSQNRRPGWQSLSSGFLRLLDAEAVWSALEKRSVQS